MATTSATIIDGVLGWKLNDEKTHAILGLTAGGNELPIAVAEEHLGQVLTSLIDATAAFPLPKGMTAKCVPALSPEWFEFGRVVGTGDYSLSFFLPSKGHLSFRMNRQMTEQLLESIEGELKGTSGPKSEKPAH